MVQPQHGKQALGCQVKQVCRQGQRKWSVAEGGRDEVDCSPAGQTSSNVASLSTGGCCSNTQGSAPLPSNLTQLYMRTTELRLTTMGFVLAPGPDHCTLAMLIYVIPGKFATNRALRLGEICNLMRP